jgi:hypothetical protein
MGQTSTDGSTEVIFVPVVGAKVDYKRSDVSPNGSVPPVVDKQRSYVAHRTDIGKVAYHSSTKPSATPPDRETGDYKSTSTNKQRPVPSISDVLYGVADLAHLSTLNPVPVYNQEQSSRSKRSFRFRSSDDDNDADSSNVDSPISAELAARAKMFELPTSSSDSDANIDGMKIDKHAAELRKKIKNPSYFDMNSDFDEDPVPPAKSVDSYVVALRDKMMNNPRFFDLSDSDEDDSGCSDFSDVWALNHNAYYYIT